MKQALQLLLIVFTHHLTAQAPDWTNYSMRSNKYPETKYLIGYLAENNYNDEPEQAMLDRLGEYAKDQLVENILVEIQSISTLNILNVNAETQEVFRRNSTSVSNATVAGLKVETYYDSKKKIGYALAYALKTEAIRHYENEVAQNLDQIQTRFTIAKNQMSDGDNQNALKTLFLIQTMLKDIEQSQTMLITLTGDFDYAGIKRKEINEYKIGVEQQLNAVRNTEQFNLEDAAFYIAYALETQLGNVQQPILVNNFTFQDTPMGSPFSRRLQAAIEQKLVAQGFSIAIKSDQPEALILKGTYWENGSKIKITTILRDRASTSALASAECLLPIVSLESRGIAYTPENYKQALINMKEFAKDEVKGGNLNIDVYTNKGKENLIFTEGDVLKLFVRANRECYLRFVYHLADGSKVLLLDNYYINRDNVNQVYELPYEFECAEPFGIETLQLNAQGEPFEALNVRSEYGYDFILDDTQTIITKSRGFKKSKSETDIKAEKRLVFTTMNK